MIELSGYTGKSASSVRDRLLAAQEMKANKPTTHKKYSIKYSLQTLVMGQGFSLIDEGFVQPVTIEAEVNSIEEFEDFIVNTAAKKHRNPQKMKKGNKHTIFSKVDDNLMYVDIVEISEN
jgi:hypothetical protein